MAPRSKASRKKEKEAAQTAPSDNVRYESYLHGYRKSKQCMAIIMDLPKPLKPCVSMLHWQYSVIHLAKKINPEIKNSGPWNCFNCGKNLVRSQHSLYSKLIYFVLSTAPLPGITGEPAHETICNPMLFLPETSNVPRPLIVDQVYFICCNGGVCRQAVEYEKSQFAPPGSVNQDLTAGSPRAGELRSSLPVVAACAKCNEEKNVMKCMGCKTIRYCSKECQRADYDRHKHVCKCVRLTLLFRLAVMYVWNDLFQSSYR